MGSTGCRRTLLAGTDSGLRPNLGYTALSDIDATTTVTAINKPRVSTIPNVLRPEIFLPASQPLVARLTVDGETATRQDP